MPAIGRSRRWEKRGGGSLALDKKSSEEIHECGVFSASFLLRGRAEGTGYQELASPVHGDGCGEQDNGVSWPGGPVLWCLWQSRKEKH